MSDVVLFDTSVLVDEARTGRHRKRIEAVEGLVRMSSVVLAELLRGVSGAAEHKFLRTLEKPSDPDCDTGELAGVWGNPGQDPCRSRVRTP